MQYVIYVYGCILGAVPISFIPTSPVEGALVGNNQTIRCTISTVSGVTPNSVTVNWIGPGGESITNSSRIMISPLTFNSDNNSTNNFSSSLKFMYFTEGDEGRYMCNVSILQTNASMAVEVGTLIGKL